MDLRKLAQLVERQGAENLGSYRSSNQSKESYKKTL